MGKHKAFQRKGRTLAITVDDLLNSPRMRIATEIFKYDKDFMRAILIELGMEAQNVAKSCIINEACKGKNYSQPAYFLRPHLQGVTDFDRYNIHWKMSNEEIEYYSKNPKGELSDSESKELLRKIKEKFKMD